MDDSESIPTSSSGTFIRKTRAQCTCPVFGASAAISQTILPSYADVMRGYHHIRLQLQQDGRTKEPSVSEILEHLSIDVERVWSIASCLYIYTSGIPPELRYG